MIGLVQIVGIEEAAIAAQTEERIVQQKRVADRAGVDVGCQVRRELRNHRARRGQRSGQRQLLSGGGQLLVPMGGSHPLQMRREDRLHGSHQTLNFKALRMLGHDGKARRHQRRPHPGHIGGAGPKFRLELGRSQPLMIAGRGGIGLRGEELFQRLLMRQRQINAEVRHGVWVCRAECLQAGSRESGVGRE